MSDHIVKHGQLEDIARDLWTKVKERDINSISYDKASKKIKATNGQTPALKLEAELTDLVSINDRAKFKQDVSVDDAKTVSNSNIGNVNGTVAAGSRTTGYRRLTSKLFTDGYVKLLRVYLPTNTGNTINAHVWMIKKGASKAEDRFIEPKIYQALQVLSSGAKKYVDVTIERTFEEETFFVLRTQGGQQIQGIDNIKPEFAEDIINVNDSFNPTSPNANANWSTYDPRTNSVGHMELHGRTGIVDISKRLDEINTASGNYVLQSETTNTGGETQYANKVVKLGADGKINSNMIPEIAINRVLQATNKDNALQLIGEGKDRLQVGDVVVLQDTNKIYIYKGKPDDQTTNDFTRDFLEISMGNGAVKSVNTILPVANGNVTITAENINLSSTSATTVKAELDKKISNITLKTGNKKQLTVTKADGTTSDVDLTSAFAADNISYTGIIGGVAKTNVKEAIDALNTEVNKGVKTIKDGRPNDQGNIDVTVAQGGATGITMTFGDGGTAIEIATYMTTEEVNQIKALFT